MKYVMTLFLFLLSTIVVADEPFHISGIYLDIRFEYKEGSPYYELIKKLTKRLSFKTNFGAYPVKRAAHFFLSNKDTCVLPTTMALIENHYPKKTENFKMLESDPIEVVTGRIFSRKGEKTLESLDQLKNKKLISWIGIPATKFIPHVEFKETKTVSDKQGITILNAGRGDYLMGWTPDTEMVAIKNKQKVPVYDPSLSYFNGTVKMVCHDVQKGRIVVNEFNKLLKEMKASGELNKLFGSKSTIAP